MSIAAVERVTKEVQAVLAMLAIRERLLTVGFDPAPLKSTAEFGALLDTEVAKWAKLINDANIKRE